MFRHDFARSCRLPAPRLLLVHILVPKLSSCDLDDPMRLRMGYLLDDVAPELQKERVDRSSSKLSLVQYDLDEYNMCGEGRRRGAVQPAALRAGPRGHAADGLVDGAGGWPQGHARLPHRPGPPGGSAVSGGRGPTPRGGGGGGTTSSEGSRRRLSTSSSRRGHVGVSIAPAPRAPRVAPPPSPRAPPVRPRVGAASPPLLLPARRQFCARVPRAEEGPRRARLTTPVAPTTPR